MAYDGTLKFDTALNDKGLQEGLDGLQKKATDALSVLTGNLMTQATNALINLGKEALTAGSSLEAGMAKVNTLYNGTDEQVGALTAEIRELSTASGLAADGLAEAAYSALSASVPAEQLGAMLEKSTKLAAAGFTDVDTALSATAKTMNAYGMAGEEAMDKVQKVLIQTQNKGITTVGELGASLSQVTPTAASFGVAFEQVGAALAVMTAQGVPTAQATTMLNGIIAELGKSGTQAAGNLEKAAEGSKYAGMSFTQMMQAGATLDEVLGIMGDYAERNGLAMVDMFSRIEAGKGALSIMAQDGQVFRDDLEAMATDADVVGEAYEKVADTVQFKGNQIKAGFQNIASGLFDLASGPIKSLQDVAIGALERIQSGLSEGGLAGVGEALLGLFEDAAGAIADIDWSGIAKSLVDGISGAIEGGGLERFLAAGRLIITSIAEGIATALPSLVPALAQGATYLGQSLVAELPAFVQAGVDLVAGLATGIAEAAPEILAGLAEIWAMGTDALVGGIQQLTEQVVPLIPGVIQAIADFVITKRTVILDAAVQVFMALADALPVVLGTLLPMIPDLMAQIVAALSSQASTLVTGAAYVFQALIDGFEQAVTALLPMVPGLLQQIADALLSNLDLLLQGGVQLFTALISALETVVEQLVPMLPVVLQTITDALVGAAPLILAAGLQLFQALLGALPVVIEQLVAMLPAIIQTVVDLLVGAAPLILEAGVQLFHALIDALPTILEALAEALPGIADAVLTALEEAGPLLLDAAVEFLMAIVDAIPDLLDALGKALPQIIDAVLAVVRDAVPRLAELALKLFLQIAEAVPQLLDKLGELLPKVVALVSDTLAELIPKLLSLLADLGAKFAEWLPKALDAVFKAAGDIVSKALEVLVSLPGKIWGVFLDALDKLLDFGEQGVEDAKNAMGDIVGAIVDAVTGLPDRLLDIGKNAIAGLWDGIKSGWNALKGGFGKLVGSLVGDAQDELEINSPSGAFRDDVGRWIPPGISQGVDKAMPAALDDLDQQADELVARMQDAVKGDMGEFDMKLSANGNGAGAYAGYQTAQEPAKWEQTNNYYVPVVTPSEAARTQREALRSYMGGVQ